MVLPPESIKIESIQGMNGFEQYDILPLLDAGAHFQKGQYIAKAWPLDDGEWTFYAARLNVLTKAGPYAKFLLDGKEIVQSDLSIENYGKLWVFLKKKDEVLAAEEAAAMEKKAMADIRQQKKREREALAAAKRACRPKRDVPRRAAAQQQDCEQQQATERENVPPPLSARTLMLRQQSELAALAAAKKRMQVEEDSSDDEQVSTIATGAIATPGGCPCGGSE